MTANDDGNAVAPPCTGDDVVVRVVWQRDGKGLRGEVVVHNVGGDACRLGGKPVVRPLAADGTVIAVETVVTLELRGRGYVVVEPGQRATAPIFWRNWCGRKPSRRAMVEWRDGSAVAAVEGPLSPDCDRTRPTNLMSSWFDVIG